MTHGGLEPLKSGSVVSGGRIARPGRLLRFDCGEVVLSQKGVWGAISVIRTRGGLGQPVKDGTGASVVGAAGGAGWSIRGTMQNWPSSLSTPCRQLVVVVTLSFTPSVSLGWVTQLLPSADSAVPAGHAWLRLGVGRRARDDERCHDQGNHDQYRSDLHGPDGSRPRGVSWIGFTV